MPLFSAGVGSRHRTTSGSNVDAEKQHTSIVDSDDDAPSLASSDHPMLSQSPSRSKNYALRYHVPRRRFTRFFSCILTSILVLLGLYLVGSAYVNEMKLKSSAEKDKPPPPLPPAWEQFPFVKAYYGGIRTLVQKSENTPEFPDGTVDQDLLDAAREQKSHEDIIDPKDGSGFQKREDAGNGNAVPRGVRFDPYPPLGDDGEFEERVQCFLNASNKAEIPQLLAYPGTPKGFPDPAMGSHELFGLRNDVCFERYGRLGPYGFGYSRAYGGIGAGMEGHREGSEEVWAGEVEVDFPKLKWAEVQNRCMEANAHRFRPASGQLNHFFTNTGFGGPAMEELRKTADADQDNTTEDMIGPNGKRRVPRTAVIIRTWKDYVYNEEAILYLRALINELALQSGTQYVVHFLIHVRNNDLQIWADDEVYQQAVDDSLPEEFRGMGTLWSERQMSLIYGGVADTVYRDLPVYGVYRSTYLPLQYFAHQHPEYDFFWHWEMDIRYTGHFHHLFDKVTQWAKKQPRKDLWERNGRFYVPSEHGTWEQFSEMVHQQTEHGIPMEGATLNKFSLLDAKDTAEYKEASQPHFPIWGPLRPTGRGDSTADPERDPRPPISYAEDDYLWGVGEEADFITFNPLFDPHNTDWILAEDVTGYNTTKGFPPRRVAIITASRLSKRMLNVMHRETTFKRHTMFSEMWPGSMALQHGLKAVYAPHPVYMSRKWPTAYLAEVFNNGMHGAAGGSRASVFSDTKQVNFRGSTWYYDAVFSPNLWKRWLGYKVDGQGGEEWETSSAPTVEGQGEGRMCLPAMLLHPIKQLDLVMESKAGM